MRSLLVPLLVAAVLLGTTVTSVQADLTPIYVPSVFDTLQVAINHAVAGVNKVVVSENGSTYLPIAMKSGVPVEAAAGETPVIDAGAANVAVQFPYNVSASTVLRGFTIRGGSYAVVDMDGGGKLVDCTIDSDGDATDYGILHGGPASVIDSCTVILEDTGVTSYGIALINSDASVQHTTVEIRDGTANDWAVWMETNVGESLPSFTYGLVKAPDGSGIHVEDGTVSFTTVDSTNGYGIESEGDGVAANCIITNASGGYEAGGDGANFNYCIAWPGGFDYPAGGTGNSQDDPLYCDLSGSQYTLRVDSYGNPENNASGYPIGAFPVACMYGTLARDAEYAGDGTLAFPGDLTVPAGLELVLGAGTTLEVSRTDSLATGNSASLVELNVSGRLEVNGSDSEPVVFDSEGQDQAEGDWYGISANSGGANLWLSHALIAHAGYGVSVGAADTAITIRDCAFEANEWIDIQVAGSDTSMAILIADNVIEVGGGIGIKFEKACGTISGNEVGGDGTSTRGIYVNLAGSVVAIAGNEVHGLSNGYGLDVAAGDPVATGNTFDENKYGLYLHGGAPDIGVDSTSAANTITGNTRGISTTCGGGTCPTCSGFAPHIRNCNITGNYFGVVTEKRGALVNLGEGGDRGVNNFYDNTSYCVWNRSVCSNDAVWAIGNYWGGCDENDFPLVCWSGDVLVDGHKCMGPDAFHVGMEEVAGRPLRVVGVFPHPVTGSARVRFETGGEDARIGVGIFDVTGRLVRTLTERHVHPGVHEMVWDGRTEAGVPAGAGLYFVRVTANDREHETVKVLVLR